MFHNKNKKTAIILSLLLSAMPLSTPAVTAFAEPENETEASSQSSEEDASEENGEEDAEENKIYETEIFDYSLTTEGTVCIELTKSPEKILDIPETIDGKKVTELGKTAFGKNDNTPYETVNLPASINYISSDNPFSVLNHLKEVNVDPANKDFVSENGVLYSKDKKKIYCYFQTNEAKSFTIPDGVEKIVQAAFYKAKFSEIKFPSSLNEMGPFAFGYCSSIENIDLSNTAVKIVDDYAFSYCDKLSDAKLPDDLDEIGGAAFANCGSLENITIPEKVTKIRQYAFVNTGLKKARIPESVTDIGYCAFGYSVTDVGNEKADNDFVIVGTYGSAAAVYAKDTDSDYDYKNDFTFRTYEEDDEVSEFENFEIHSSGDFQYAVVDGEAVITGCVSTAKVLNIPDSIDGNPVTKLYSCSMSYAGAEEIIVPESVKHIRKLAFYQCKSLKKVTLPQSLETIESNAFEGCPLLEEVDLGGAVTIGDQIFKDSPMIKKVTLSGNCKTIADGAENPFVSCDFLEEINVTSGDGEYSSEDGILYNSDKTTLYHYPASKSGKKFKAPSGLKQIASTSFTAVKELEEIDISSVTIIDPYSFTDCEALKKAKLSKDLERIGDYAFYGCTSLKSLRFYKKLDKIGEYAFGFHYSRYIQNDDGSTGGPELEEDFKVYADKGTDAYKYAKNNNIKVVDGTMDIFGLNINKKLFVLIFGGVSAVVALTILNAVLKFIKKKKKKNEKNTDTTEKKENEKDDDDK